MTKVSARFLAFAHLYFINFLTMERIKLFEASIREWNDQSMKLVQAAYEKEVRKTNTILIILTVLGSLVLLASLSLG